MTRTRRQADLELISIDWLDDTRNLLIVWVALMGAALCHRNNDHIASDFFVDLLEKRNPFLRKMLEILNTMLVLFFLVVFAKTVLKVIIAIKDSILPMIPISKSWALLPFFISSLLMIAYSLKHIFSIMSRK